MAFFTSTFQFYGFVAIISAVLFQCCGGKKKKKTINKKGKKRTEATTKGKPAAAKKPADLRASTAAVVPSFYYKNNVDEKQSRWGAKTIEGSGHQGSISLDKLRAYVLKSDQITKEKTLSHMPKSSEGYGGKFGIQADRQDKSAAEWQEREQVAKHASQTDYKKGFGGQFGIEADRQDKSAAGWEEHEQVAKHASQTDNKKSFDGLFDVQTDYQDKFCPPLFCPKASIERNFPEVSSERLKNLRERKHLILKTYKRNASSHKRRGSKARYGSPSKPSKTTTGNNDTRKSSSVTY